MEYLPFGSQGLTRLTKEQPFKHLKTPRSGNFSGVHSFVRDNHHTSLSPIIGWLTEKMMRGFCQQDTLKTTFTFCPLMAGSFEIHQVKHLHLSHAQSHRVKELNEIPRRLS